MVADCQLVCCGIQSERMSAEPLRQSVCPRFICYFEALSSSLVQSAIGFGKLYQEFWDFVYVEVTLSRPIGDSSCKLKEFWRSLESFDALSRNKQFQQACIAVDRLVYADLSDVIMRNASLDTAELVAWMKETAHGLAGMMHQFLWESLLSEQWVLDRVESIHRFCKVLLKRAIFVKSLEQ